MKAVSNIQRITKTMQMIATARFQASQRRATEAKPYTEKIAELVRELAGAAAADGDGSGGGSQASPRTDHPLLRAPHPAVGRRLLLVLTSNRGLCGGYNASVLRTAAAFLRDASGQKTDLELVGKKGLAYFKFAGLRVAEFHSHFTDTPAYEQVERLASRFMDRFIEGKYDSVYVAYMAFESISRQKPNVLELLPLRAPGSGQDQPAPGRGGSSGGGSGAGATYEFSPPPQQLLDELLPVTVKTQLFQCFNEAAVSEHIARMVAMKSATDAAGKMRKSLTRQFNRARQTAITTELSEIIGGAAALQ